MKIAGKIAQVSRWRHGYADDTTPVAAQHPWTMWNYNREPSIKSIGRIYRLKYNIFLSPLFVAFFFFFSKRHRNNLTGFVNNLLVNSIYSEMNFDLRIYFYKISNFAKLLHLTRTDSNEWQEADTRCPIRRKRNYVEIIGTCISGWGRVFEASAERCPRKNLVREIRTLGGDGWENDDEQSAHRRDGNRSKFVRRTAEHRVCEQSESPFRVPRLANERIAAHT